MSDQDKTVKLLTEIRDLLVDREKKYDKYLADASEQYSQQVNASRGAKTRLIFSVGLFCIIYAAVYLATHAK